VCLDVERRKAKGVPAEEADKVVVYECPIERSIQGNKYEDVIGRGGSLQPRIEPQHTLLRCESAQLQYIERKACNLKRLGNGISVQRLKLTRKRSRRIVNAARSDGKQA